MMTSGTAIDRIVRGWRSRRSSDICSAGGTSTGSSGLIRASASSSRVSPMRVEVVVRVLGHRLAPVLSGARRRPLPRIDWIILASGVQART